MLSQTLATTALAVGLRLLGAVVVWIVGRYVIGLAVRMVSRALERQHVDPTLLRYIGSIVSVSLNILLVVAILGYFGVETTSLPPWSRPWASRSARRGPGCCRTSPPACSSWGCAPSRSAT